MSDIYCSQSAKDYISLYDELGRLSDDIRDNKDDKRWFAGTGEYAKFLARLLRDKDSAIYRDIDEDTQKNIMAILDSVQPNSTFEQMYNEIERGRYLLIDEMLKNFEKCILGEEA